MGLLLSPSSWWLAPPWLWPLQLVLVNMLTDTLAALARPWRRSRNPLGVSQFFGCTPFGPVAWTMAAGSAATDSFSGASFILSK
jgi:hypothetical protein